MHAVRAAAALLALTGCMAAGCSLGGDDEPRTAKGDFVVSLDRRSTLEPESDFGAVGLIARDGKTIVTVEVSKPAAPRQQAEIRRGNCESIDLAITYQLEPLLDGKSETVVNAPLRVLRRGGYVVLVHDVPAEARIGDVCGDLAKSQPPSAAPTFD
jgi:hypothetical protein